LVHRTFGTEKQGMVRFSFSHFNTMEDVKAAIDALWTIGEDAK
jgi:selenocysteine lyase/cysteine desulfurase